MSFCEVFMEGRCKNVEIESGGEIFEFEEKRVELMV